jgi:multidrug resistance efflux pump
VVYDISIDFPSIVTAVNVKEGDRVGLGQSLVTLDISEYKANMEKLQQQLIINEAGLKTVTQDLASLVAEIAQLEKDIQRKSGELTNGTNANLRNLQSAFEVAQRDLEKVKNDFSNYQQLYAAGAVSKDLLDQHGLLVAQKDKSVSDLQNNINKLKTDLQTELDQLNISLIYKRAQLNQLTNANSANTIKQNSSIAVSKIELENLKSKGSKAYIKDNLIVSSLENGIIKNLKVINGNRLGAQAMPTAVLQLIDASSIIISAEVDEEFIKNVKLGESVKIVPEFNKALTLDGKRIIKVEVKPEDSEGLLKPGYSADVYFPFE